jgi:hypothetical protein
MKKILWLLIPLSVSMLCACSANLPATPTLDPAGTFTAVARTMSADQPTATPAASTSTPEPTQAATATLFPTIAPVTTLASTVISYTSSTGTACDDAAYVADITISDGTKIYPGATFEKTWEISNTGTCTWDTDYALTFVSGSQMSGTETALEESVAPGESVDITVEMTAPTTETSYTGYWRMQNASDTLFGDTIYVNIVVTDSASTSTPTATSTGTTSTATPTTTTAATSAPTSTTAPTTTTAPTATTAPTDTPVPATEVPTTDTNGTASS